MPSRVRFEPNRKGISAFAVSPRAQAIVLAKAEQAKTAAETLAPRQSGHYAQSFQVEPVTVVINGLSRAGARLTNTARYAAVLEVGRQERDGQHVLSRALDAIRG
jgi:hypothetical protein